MAMIIHILQLLSIGAFLFSSCSAQVCEDKTTEQFQLSTKKPDFKKNCNQILRKFPHFCNYKSIVRENCPKSCALCGSASNAEFCLDVSGSFTLAKGTKWEKVRSCSHAESNPDKWCNKFTFKKKCPVACNYCSPTSTTPKCNGLESNCFLKVNELLFPMLHNANHDTAPLQNHNEPLEQALEAGYRGLMLDVCKSNAGELNFCHGRINLGNRDITEVATNLVSFLDANPNDVIIINFEISVGTPSPSELWNVLTNVNGFENKVYQYPGSNAQWPTLETLTSQGRQLILFQHNHVNNCPGGNGCTPKIYDWFDYVQGNNWDYDNVNAVKDYANSCSIRRGANGKKHFYSLNNFVTAWYGPSGPSSDTLNSKAHLYEMLNACENRMNDEVNFINIDYWQRGKVVEFANEVNADRANRRKL